MYHKMCPDCGEIMVIYYDEKIFFWSWLCTKCGYQTIDWESAEEEVLDLGLEEE